MKALKKITPKLGIASVIIIALLIVLLAFVDSQLMFATLTGTFVVFCVLIPLNFILNKK